MGHNIVLSNNNVKVNKRSQSVVMPLVQLLTSSALVFAGFVGVQLAATAALTGLAGEQQAQAAEAESSSLQGAGALDLHDEPSREYVNDMQVQPALKAQDEHPDQPGVPAARLPPEGAVPRGHRPYKYAQNPMLAEEKLVNPYANDFSPATIEAGRKAYERTCIVCHGPRGAGDGPVAKKMTLLPPPPLTSDKVKNFKDGRIFHIITDGQGVMKNYLYQLPNEEDRWKVVNYVRSLQQQAKPF